MRIHFLLFGKYAINEERPGNARMSLTFDKGAFHVYSCSVKFIEEPLDYVYDWPADVLSAEWDPKAAKKKLLAKPDMWVTDALLDQNIFAGVGNIIKNEVLYRIKVHPESKIGLLPSKQLTQLVKRG